jgi:hypothetical protein
MSNENVGFGVLKTAGNTNALKTATDSLFVIQISINGNGVTKSWFL